MQIATSRRAALVAAKALATREKRPIWYALHTFGRRRTWRVDVKPTSDPHYSLFVAIPEGWEAEEAEKVIGRQYRFLMLSARNESDPAAKDSHAMAAEYLLSKSGLRAEALARIQKSVTEE